MQLNSFYKIMIFCLLSTILLEFIGAFILKVRNKKDYLNIFLVNVVTNPIVVLFPYVVYLYYGILYRNILLIILEILVVIIEGLFYKKYLKFNEINYFKLSLILNLASYGVGVIIDIFV